MATITFTGNVGTEPELNFYNGKNGEFGVCSFSVAEGERVKDANGNWVDGDTTWYRVSVLGKQSEAATEIKKGDRVLIVGTFKQGKPYQAKDGSTRQSLEVKAESFAIVPRFQNKQQAQTQNETDWSAPWNS